MSFVTTQPEALSAAATTLHGIGSGVNAQNAAAAAPITGVVPAAADVAQDERRGADIDDRALVEAVEGADGVGCAGVGGAAAAGAVTW